MGSTFWRILLSVLALALLIAPFTTFLASPVLADGPCTTRADNMTRNGSITDGGYDTAHGVVANSWNAFLINGEWPAYDLADNESANGDIGGSSSQYIHGDGTRFDAGIYQVVTGTAPGASYDFSVGWAAMLRDTGGGHNTKVDDVVIRRVGVDPYGGTDPTSQNMRWGPEVGTGSSGRSLNNPDMRITFEAMANQVTVFLRVYNLSSSASDKVFFDVMCMLPRGDIPLAQVQPSPTATSLATQVPPTDAPVVRPTRELPTLTPTPPPPTATPIPAQFLTATPRSVAKIEVTLTPPPRGIIPQTLGSIGTSSSDNNPGSSPAGGGNAISVAVIAGSVGIISLSLLGIVLIGGFAVWRIFMRQADHTLDSPYYPDDQIHSS
jgi:hypothetical protein